MAKEKLGELSEAELQFLENDKTPDSEETADASKAGAETQADLTKNNPENEAALSESSGLAEENPSGS
jgi:hypothetical protein